MLTHTNLVASARQLRRMLRVSGRDTTLAVVPFFHIMGFMVNLALPLVSGATVVTMPRFDLERFLALIQRKRATFLAVPPPIMAALAHHPLVEAYDLSSVELLEPVDDEHVAVAVIGRPDAQRGEVPVAVVVHRGEIEGDDLIAWVAERVAPHKRIRAVRFVEAIPKTPSGKVLRQILVERDRQSTGVTSS
jgi:acyl-CoA synthetase (AMP-forming)/AMP-acid ligase II